MSLPHWSAALFPTQIADSMSKLGAPGFRAATVGSYAAVGGQAVRSLLLARILSPALFGLLNITNIGSNLTAYADMGAGPQGERQAAHERGLGRLDSMEAELLSAAGARMFPAGVLFLGGTLAGLIVANGNRLLSIQLAFLAGSAPLMALWMSCRGWLHVHGQISRIAYCQLAQVFVWLLIVPLAAFWRGIEGALASMLFSYVPPVLVAWRGVPVHKFLLPNLRAFRQLAPRGLALWFVQVANFVYVNADQALLSARLGSAAVGLYALGTMVATALTALSDAAALAGHVKTLESVARAGYLSPEFPSVTRVMHTVLLGFSALVPLAWAGTAALTILFLPQFVESLPVVALLGAGASMIGVTVASNASLLSVGLHRSLPRIVLVATAAKLGLMAVVLQIWPSVTAAAAAAVFGAGIVALGTLHLLARGFQRPARTTPGLSAEFLQGGLILVVGAAAASVAFHAHGAMAFLLASLATLIVSLPLGLIQYRSRTRH